MNGYYLRCDRCGGRGWLMGDRNDWPCSCADCKGIGAITFCALGLRLGEDPRALRRVAAIRSRPINSARILDKLAAHFVFA